MVPESASVPAFSSSTLDTFSFPAILSVAKKLSKARLPTENVSLFAIVTVYVPGIEIVAATVELLGAPLGFQSAAVPQSPLTADFQKSPLGTGTDPIVMSEPPFPSETTAKSVLLE